MRELKNKQLSKFHSQKRRKVQQWPFVTANITTFSGD